MTWGEFKELINLKVEDKDEMYYIDYYADHLGTNCPNVTIRKDKDDNTLWFYVE